MADVGVDPALREITIEFDQAMDTRGQSICGGGPTFPTLDGKPGWKDQRTFVIPVMLEPGRTYSFSVNCSGAQNTRSARGEAAESYIVSFKTMPVGVEGKPAALTAKDVDEALIKLEVGIRDAYSYRDLRGVDWAAEMVATREEAKACTTGPKLARLIAHRLGKAQDPHVSVRFDDFTLATYRRDVKPNINLRRLHSVVAGWKRIGTAQSGLFEGTLDGGIGYLCVAGWSFSSEDADALQKALDGLKDAPALVVDVRANSGGDEALARSFASCFVDKPTVYSRSLVRSVAAPGDEKSEGESWQGPFDRVVEPAAEGSGLPRYRGRVAVLMGPVCMSSNESFLLMMRHGAGAKLFGQFSYGSSGNPKPHDIGCGITVLLPSWKNLDIDGTLVEGRGIAPDVSVEAQPADFEKEDPVLNKALAWLRAQAK